MQNPTGQNKEIEKKNNCPRQRTTRERKQNTETQFVKIK